MGILENIYFNSFDFFIKKPGWLEKQSSAHVEFKSFRFLWIFILIIAELNKNQL